MAEVTIVGTYKEQGEVIEYETSFRIPSKRIPTVTLSWSAAQLKGSIVGDATQQIRLVRTDLVGDEKFTQVFTVGDLV